MGAAQSAYLSFSHYQNEKRKERAQKLANSRRGKRMMESRRMKRYVAKREEELGRGAELRRQQEVDTTKGERVWFSRCIQNGRLQHWVLIAHGMKYELRRGDHVKAEPGSEAEKLKQEPYICNIKEFTIDQEQREASLTELLVPEVDGYYVCLIGWTKCSQEEVNSVAHDVMSTFGKYSLLRNNCQDFLRQLAGRILIGPKAADYPWFLSNTKTAYQKDQWLKPPPSEMLMRYLERSSAMSVQQTHLHIQHQLHTQHQTQLQIQNQIQNQIQLQIQNQIQMQMQTQMMMQNNAGGAGGM